ncbi:hypothetical protein VTL71DRAFT_6623 [Oculimacula yallundae]|uniref:Palmitoyltransferase n=1 Tax=Oculimacula yallundae TaxID=86028 RepID=A0ABR4BYE6_9HELO
MAFQTKDPGKAQRMNIAVNIWTARIIPIILAGIVGYAIYVLVVVLCVHYLLIKHNDSSAAIAILAVHFTLFLLMAASFFRLLYITILDPPLVPLGPNANRASKSRSKDGKEGSASSDIGGGEYNSGQNSRGTSSKTVVPEEDPDSPGLELFYTKDVFICELDGKPKWCSHCANWKPDRAHHCSANGRCVKKMDHFCPWVGGPVGENNMKFFIQFTSYTALYCLHLLVVMAIYVARQRSSPDENVNAQLAVILGLASFFFMFTAGMAGSSINDALWNLTQVEHLVAKTRIHTLAVIKPPHDKLLQIDPEKVSQPPYAEITYPLGAGIPGYSREPGVPAIKSNSHAGQWRPNPTVPSLDSASQLPSNADPLNPPTAIRSSDAPAAFPTEPSTQLHMSNPVSQEVPTQTFDPSQARNNAGGNGQISKRDLQATRTFAILSMPDVNQNPWDLGSAYLNVKSLMGNRIIDWFLPIRRSPCCDHESTESQFPVGPYVEEIRRIAGFVEDHTVGGHESGRSKNLSDSSRSDGDTTIGHIDDTPNKEDVEMRRIKGSGQRSTEMAESATHRDGR